jgi:hypothetical protein
MSLTITHNFRERRERHPFQHGYSVCHTQTVGGRAEKLPKNVEDKNDRHSSTSWLLVQQLRY